MIGVEWWVVAGVAFVGGLAALVTTAAVVWAWVRVVATDAQRDAQARVADTPEVDPRQAVVCDACGRECADREHAREHIAEVHGLHVDRRKIDALVTPADAEE